MEEIQAIERSMKKLLAEDNEAKVFREQVKEQQEEMRKMNKKSKELLDNLEKSMLRIMEQKIEETKRRYEEVCVV